MAVEFNEEHFFIVLVFVNGGLSTFVIKFSHMDETPFYKRPRFYIAGWLAFLLLFYGAQIYRMGGVEASSTDIFFDLFCIFPIFFVIWMAFFAQFVLPVKTAVDRQKIFDRLVSHLFRNHGPALFVKDGEIKEHSGERLKKGPGVVWLDSASAAVTRTATAIKQVMGPGVYFINRGEFIAGTPLDLHIQTHSLGPREKDNPFDEKKETQSKEEWDEIQERRKEVSALTRDGIEVVPNITVRFRVDTGIPEDNEPGSRFGYRTGVTERAKQAEKEDKEAIRKAILGEAINPNMNTEDRRRRVAWNELPAALAVDVWREYAAKFTLDELFNASQVVPPPLLRLAQPTAAETRAPSQPVQVDLTKRTMRGGLAGMLQVINRSMEKAIHSLEGDGGARSIAPAPPPPPAPVEASQEPPKKTALQVINDMVTARLTQPQVDELGDTGKRGVDPVDSEEYKLLQKRGLKVLGVSISSIRLNPALEEQLIKQWSTNWLKTAKEESEQLDRKRGIVETTAREQTQISYARRLSREVNDFSRKEKLEVKGLLKALLLRSRAMIRSGEYSDQLRRRMTTELLEIEEMLKWVEENGR